MTHLEQENQSHVAELHDAEFEAELSPPDYEGVETKDAEIKAPDSKINRQSKEPPRPVSTFRYVIGLPLRIHLSGPFVYAMVVPIFFLDLCLMAYQAICFRLWRIPLVQRSEFVIVDRHKLEYLNAIEKLNCVYCGYANGVLAFAMEIAARTERNWCPIKHGSHPPNPHDYYEEFVDFGASESWYDHPARNKPGRACEDCWHKK